MRSLKTLWSMFDRGDSLTTPELLALYDNIQKGISFLEARGETGGVLFKARLNRESLSTYLESRSKQRAEAG